MPLGNPIQKNNDTRIVSATATAGQVQFTVTGGYTINAISVFRNGVRLSNSDDFTASDGSTVSLNVAADVGDALDFHVFDKFTVANAIVGAASTQTISGNLRVTGELYSDDFKPDNIITTGIATVGTLNVTGTSTFSDDVTFTGAAANVTWDKSTDDLIFNDNAQAKFGTSGDLSIYHASSDNNSYIVNGTGNLYIRAKVGENSIVARPDGAVSLAHDDNSKLTTTNTGVIVSGILTATNSISIGDTGSGTDVYGDASGIGIGTADPTYKFHVETSGSAALGRFKRSDAGQALFQIMSQDGGNVVLGLGDGTDPDIQYIKSDNSNDSLSFGSNTAERMRIDSSGRVVVGSSTVYAHANADDLQVGITTGNHGIAIISGAWDNGEIHFGDGSSSGNANVKGQIVYTHSIDAMRFFTDVTERLRITSDGVVGINQSSPDSNSMLDVMSDDTGTTVNSNRIALFRTNGAGRDAHITLSNSSNTPVNIGLLSSDLYFTTNNSERLRITSAGSVGINTTSPNRRFTLYQDATTRMNLKSLADSSVGIEFGDPDDENIGYMVYDNSSNYLAFGVNAGERLRIDSSGRVLIGTTTEGSDGSNDLTINNSGNGGITIRNGTTSNGNVFFSDATSGAGEYAGYLQYRHNGDKLVFGAGSTEKMHLTSTGLEIYTGNGAGAPDPGYGLKVFGGTNHRDYPAIYLAGGAGSSDNSGIWAKYNLTLGCDQGNAIASREIAFNNGDARIAGFTHDGLTFGSDSAAANALDDYEEGTYTPTPNANLTLNVNYNTWSYTKIGRQVTVRGLFLPQAVSSTDAITCSLPFAAADLATTSNAGGVLSMAAQVSGATAGVASFVGDGLDHMRFYGMTEGGAWFRVANDDIGTNTEIYFSHTYFAAT